MFRSLFAPVLLLAIFSGALALAQEEGKASAPAAGKQETPEAESKPPTYKAPKVNADELRTILQTRERFYVLDVRKPAELEQKGTLEGYVNIPVEELEARLTEIPKDARILSLCNTGNRAGKAAAILEKHGYAVRAVGGLKEWGEKGWDLIYPEAPAKPDSEAVPEKGSAKKPGP